jgi:uncharacterized protein YqeY
MTQLKERLRADLTAAIKGQDELTRATLRMALAAVTTEEVAGAQARELTDAEVLRVLGREAKKRREAADAFAAGGRPERAERERAEGEVLERYLPTQLSDAEIGDLVRDAIAETGAANVRQMGVVVKAVQARTEGRAEGRRIADEVRRQLAG